jgi:hypothetical protein
MAEGGFFWCEMRGSISYLRAKWGVIFVRGRVESEEARGMMRTRRVQEDADEAPVDFELGRRKGQPGWQELRIVFDFHDPKHLKQVDAVIDTLLKVRLMAAREDDDESAEEAP